MNHQIVPMVQEFLSKNEIVVSDNTDAEKLVYILTKYFDALIYNIVSVIALVANVEEYTKIQPKHLVAAQVYIAQKCIGSHASKKILGGSREITLEELNKMETPLLGENMGENKYKIDVELRSLIHQVLQHHNMQIGKDAMKGIVKIIYEHLECLLHDIKKNEPLTLKKLENIMDTRRYSIFK